MAFSTNSLADKIKSEISLLEHFKRHYSYSIEKRYGKSYNFSPCPICGHQSKDRKKTCFGIKDNYFHCFACGEDGSIIDLEIKTRGLDTRQAILELAQEYGLIEEKETRQRKNTGQPQPQKRPKDTLPSQPEEETNVILAKCTFDIFVKK